MMLDLALSFEEKIILTLIKMVIALFKSFAKRENYFQFQIKWECMAE